MFTSLDYIFIHGGSRLTDYFSSVNKRGRLTGTAMQSCFPFSCIGSRVRITNDVNWTWFTNKLNYFQFSNITSSKIFGLRP